MKWNEVNDVYQYLDDYLCDLIGHKHSEVISEITSILAEEGLLDYDILKDWVFDQCELSQ